MHNFWELLKFFSEREQVKWLDDDDRIADSKSNSSKKGWNDYVELGFWGYVLLGKSELC